MIRYMFKTKLYKKYNKMLQTKINYLVFFVFTLFKIASKIARTKTKKPFRQTVKKKLKSKF